MFGAEQLALEFEQGQRDFKLGGGGRNRTKNEMQMMDMNKTGHEGMKHMSGMKHHMWMFFHTAIDDTILFDFWTVNSVRSMLVSCLILFFAGVGFEALKWSRLLLDNRWRQQRQQSTRNPVNGQASNGSLNPPSATLTSRYRNQLFSVAHLIQTLLFFIQVLWGYLLMLVFMTFSVWLGLAIVLGAATGFYLFSGAVRSGLTTHQASSSSADLVTREHGRTGLHGRA